MSSIDKINQLKASLKSDIEKRDKFLARIKEKEAQINELENLEIANEVKAFTLAGNVPLIEFLAALKAKDVTKINQYIKN